MKNRLALFLNTLECKEYDDYYEIIGKSIWGPILLCDEYRTKQDNNQLTDEWIKENNIEIDIEDNIKLDKKEYNKDRAKEYLIEMLKSYGLIKGTTWCSHPFEDFDIKI